MPARAPLALIVLLLGFLSLSAVAMAGQVVVHDRAGEAQPFADIRKVSVRHDRDGRIRYVVTVQHGTGKGRVDLLTKQGLGIDIRVGAQRYSVNHFGVAGPGDEGVFTQAHGRTRVRQRGDRIELSFPRRAIASPDSFRWRAEIFTWRLEPNGEIEYGRNNRDRAPNHGYRTYDLTGRRAALTIPVRGDRARFVASCPPSADCRASVKVEAGKVLVARGGYSIAAGESKEVDLPLTDAGREALRANGSIGGKLTITDVDTGKRKVVQVVLEKSDGPGL